MNHGKMYYTQDFDPTTTTGRPIDFPNTSRNSSFIDSSISPWNERYGLIRLLYEVYIKPDYASTTTLNNMLKQFPLSWAEAGYIKRSVFSYGSSTDTHNVDSVPFPTTKDISRCSTSTPTLSTLPDELILQIIKQVFWLDLLSLLHTSRNISRVVSSEVIKQQYSPEPPVSPKASTTTIIPRLLLHNIFSMSLTYILGSLSSHVVVHDSFSRYVDNKRMFGYRLISECPSWRKPFCEPPLQKIRVHICNSLGVKEHMDIENENAVTIQDIFEAMENHTKDTWIAGNLFTHLQWYREATFLFWSQEKPELKRWVRNVPSRPMPLPPS